MQKLVVFTGAGISAESGLSTFRDASGVWNTVNLDEVATPRAWTNNPTKVLDFHNQYRRQIFESEPNAAHFALAKLEAHFDVQIITQNIDNLHERAGSSKVLHLHGNIFQAQSTADASLIYQLEGWQLNHGDLCKHNAQLRPNVVWFGEPVPAMEEAEKHTSQANFMLIVGTSLKVFPAADLLHIAPAGAQKMLVDPQPSLPEGMEGIHVFAEKATLGVPKAVAALYEFQAKKAVY